MTQPKDHNHESDAEFLLYMTLDSLKDKKPYALTQIYALMAQAHATLALANAFREAQAPPTTVPQQAEEFDDSGVG